VPDVIVLSTQDRRIIMIRNKVTALLLAVAFACTTFFSTTASASEVNTSLAANPTATLSAIDSIGTPLSDQVAGEVRGEGWNLATLKYLYNGSTAIRWYLNSYSAQTQFGWVWGRLIAVLEGKPDPGLMPNQALINKAIYAVANSFAWTYTYFN